MACVFVFPNGDRRILQCQEKGHETHRMLIYADPEGRDSTMVDMLAQGKLGGEAMREAQFTKDLRESMVEDE
jgi:hypothetical protein